MSDEKHVNEEIMKVTQYVTASGKQVSVLTAFASDSPDQFVGQARVMLETPQGNIPQMVKFHIPAATVVEAFEKFDEFAGKEINSFAERLQGNRIVEAQAMPNIVKKNQKNFQQ